MLSRTEYRSCAVFMVLDHSTRRVCRLHNFTQAHSGSYYSGKVNGADKFYLVIESVKPDAKHNRCPNRRGLCVCELEAKLPNLGLVRASQHT